MKTNLFLCLLAVVVAGLGGLVRAADDFESIDATLRDRAVVMELPEGVRRVRLRVRLGDGTWKLCTIAHLAGVERFLKLRLPDGALGEEIEVAASFTDPFPYSHYQGQSSFGTTASDPMAVSGPMSPGGFEDGTTAPNEGATVEESDIWKWRGRTLYFFNQYRGLQVIDVSDPAVPERLATHRLPASGEQMYLHPSADLVILLAHDPGTGTGEVVLVRHPSRNALVWQEDIPVRGYILESRMVGEMLYVVSRHQSEVRRIDPDTGAEHVTWRSGLSVTKIDLSDPDYPVVDPALNLSSENFNYWGAQVQAVPEALLISTSAYDSLRQQSVSTVHVVDISDPSVTPAVTHEFPIAGQVRNKFNMRLEAGILTVVSQVWRGGAARQTYASVETFDLTNPVGGGSAPLGQLEFAQNESITATRFVGDLCYVVTFLRVDPLFVVSLADPAHPRLLGELEIPGFSTYLEPFGEEALISVGVEDSQIAVSWFDVSDPAHPALSSRVYVGSPDGWSWTEANWDEKAFGFFPDEGLILLPYQGSDPVRGRITGVQVIELGDGNLIKCGSFEQEFQARRARVLDTAVASISGRSLRTLDISDLDKPRILSELTLAWPADLVHRVGEWLVQVERTGGSYWYQAQSPPPSARLHVSPVSDPEILAATLDLGPGRVAGSLLAGDCLWVAQSLTEVTFDADQYSSTERFVVTAIDLATPERPRIAGRDSWTTTSDGYPYSAGADLAGAILPDGSLAWYPTKQDYNYFFLDPLTDGMMGGFMPYYRPSPGRVCTVEIADKTNPRILAVVDLRESDQHWAEGGYRLVGSILYYGFQGIEEVPQSDGTVEWRARHWLGQLDLSAPELPVKRDLVILPGTFEHALGTPSGGVVLFTSRMRTYDDGGLWFTEYRVQGLAFDGVMAYLLDEIVVPDKGYGPNVFDGSLLVLGRTDYEASPIHTDLSVYRWLPGGSFHLAQILRRPESVYRLGVSEQLLISAEQGRLTFIDFFDPGAPKPAMVSVPSSNFWQGIDLIDIHQREFAYVPEGLWGVGVVDFGGVFAVGVPELAEEDGPEPGPEWITIELGALAQTAGDDDSLIGALGTDEAWLAASSAVQTSYDDWMRDALGLAAGAPVPPADLDNDRDGLTNGWEYWTGSDPGRAASGRRPRTFVSTAPGGARFLSVRVFLNPHASGSLRPELSFNAIDWNPYPDSLEFVFEPFSPSVVVGIPDSVPGADSLFLRFSFHPH